MAPKKKTLGRPKGLGPAREPLVSLRGSQQWKDWLDEFAAHCRLGLTDTIEQSLIRYAEERGFDKPPKR
jgi:hypothetical protein